MPDVTNPTDSENADSKLLSQHLEERGHTSVVIGAFAGKSMPLEEWLAIQLWDVVAHGKLPLSNGEEIPITDFKDWHSAVKTLLERIEGTPTQRIRHFDAGDVKMYAVVSPDDWDRSAAPSEESK